MIRKERMENAKVTIRYPFGPAEVVEVPKTVADDFSRATKKRDRYLFEYKYPQDAYPALTAYCLYLGKCFVKSYLPQAFPCHNHIYLAARHILQVTTLPNAVLAWEPHRCHDDEAKSTRPEMFQICDAIYDSLKEGKVNKDVLWNNQLMTAKKNCARVLNTWLHNRQAVHSFFTCDTLLKLILTGASSRVNRVNEVGHYVRNGFCFMPDFILHRPYDDCSLENNFQGLTVYFEHRKDEPSPLPEKIVCTESFPQVAIVSSATRANHPWFSTWFKDGLSYTSIYDRATKEISSEVAANVTRLLGFVCVKRDFDRTFLPMPNLTTLQIDLYYIPRMHRQSFLSRLSQACPNLVNLLIVYYGREIQINDVVQTLRFPALRHLYFSGHLHHDKIVAPDLTSVVLNNKPAPPKRFLPSRDLRNFLRCRHVTLKDMNVNRRDLTFISQKMMLLEILSVETVSYEVKKCSGLEIAKSFTRDKFASPNMVKFTTQSCGVVFDLTGNVIDDACLAVGFAFRHANRGILQTSYRALLPGLLWAAFACPSRYPSSTTTTTTRVLRSSRKRKAKS